MKSFKASTYENKGKEFEAYVKNLMELYGSDQGKICLFYEDSGLEFLGNTIF